jgi:AcrR family transcriptional regulator
MQVSVPTVRTSQAERRARSRAAILEAAARGLSRQGYARLNLEQVAREAGYTRGALYHQFADKEALALDVVAWVEQTWYAQMSPLFDTTADPVGALRGMAREHAIYCRRDVARVMLTLRVEFTGQDDPVGRAVHEAGRRIVRDVARLISAARDSRAIPSGPDPTLLALGLVSALEGLVIDLRGHEPLDVELADRLVLGLLGLAPDA